MKRKAQFELSHGCQKMRQTQSVGKSTADPTGVSNARGAASASKGPFDATTPTWTTLADEPSTSDKGNESEGVDSMVTNSPDAEVDELADDSDLERISCNVPVSANDIL
jgi:hypothetical protein